MYTKIDVEEGAVKVIVGDGQAMEDETLVGEERE